MSIDYSTLDDAGSRWDDGDLAAMQAMRAEGRTYREIALRLGRTPAAVASKLHWLRERGIDFPKGAV